MPAAFIEPISQAAPTALDLKQSKDLEQVILVMFALVQERVLRAFSCQVSLS